MVAEWQFSLDERNGSIYYDDPNPLAERVVFLFHGLGVDSRSWYFQVAALCEAGFRPLVIDLPGYGKSIWPTKRWSFEGVAKILKEFTLTFSADKKYIVGISLGGAFTLRLLAMAPGFFDGAVLINAFSKIKPHGLSNTIFLFTRLLKVSTMPMKEQAEYMAARLFPDQKDDLFREMIVEQIVSSDRKVYLQTLLQLAALNLDRNLRKVTTPCVLITGAEDSTIHPESQAIMAKSLSNCSQIVIQGAGHAVIVQEPESVNAIILNFIKTH
jgi:3-oxoadipate enol-lactonase